MSNKGPETRDYLAELCVAGVMADRGWNIYFPHRDVGFDMIATYDLGPIPIIRPVQVKGKYPTASKTDKARYGFVGRLSLTHPDMILAIPYFGLNSLDFPAHIAWVGWSDIKPSSRGYSAEYARFSNGAPEPRPGFVHLFNREGMERLLPSGAPK